MQFSIVGPTITLTKRRTQKVVADIIKGGEPPAKKKGKKKAAPKKAAKKKAAKK
jgi:hypothetical protein